MSSRLNQKLKRPVQVSNVMCSIQSPWEDREFAKTTWTWISWLWADFFLSRRFSWVWLLSFFSTEISLSKVSCLNHTTPELWFNPHSLSDTHSGTLSFLKLFCPLVPFVRWSFPQRPMQVGALAHFYHCGFLLSVCICTWGNDTLFPRSYQEGDWVQFL